jgi:hypothetical protein
MRMTTTYCILALALISLGIVARQGVFRTTDATNLNHYAGRELTGPTVPMTSGSKSGGDSRMANLNESSSTNISQSATNSKELLPEKISGVDTAVVGRAFPISASVEADCKRKQDYICNDVQQKLEQMRQQPRDLGWATEMEALIRHDVLYEEQPDRFRIRHIECRASLCAAEVDSTLTTNGTYGSYMGGMQVHHDALNAALHTNLNTFSYETDASGARVTVTVITFTRR